MAGKEARKIIECDCSDGGVYKVYRNLSEFAAALDVSNATAFYRIRNEKPVGGKLYLYEDGYQKKFPVVAARTDFDKLYESYGIAVNKSDKKNDEIKSEPEPVKAEPEEDKTEVADMKKDEISEQADKQTSEPATDMVNHPHHYCTGGIECFDAMLSTFGKDWMIVYCNINAFKYAWRAKHKNNFVEDMRKSAWYSTKAAELAEVTEG